jgi:hypothetical protein
MTITEHVAHTLGVSLSDASPLRSASSRSQLPALFTALAYRDGAEVGVWEGAFSEELARGMPALQRLRCVDPWIAYRRYNERKNVQRRLDVAYASAQARLHDLPCDLLRMTSVEAARLVPDRSLDFVYIDANHAEAFVREDIEAWAPKVRAGGCLCGHDYDLSQKAKAKHSWIEVQPVVDAYVRAHRIAPLFILAGDRSPSWLWVQP